MTHHYYKHDTEVDVDDDGDTDDNMNSTKFLETPVKSDQLKSKTSFMSSMDISFCSWSAHKDPDEWYAMLNR